MHSAPHFIVDFFSSLMRGVVFISITVIFSAKYLCAKTVEKLSEVSDYDKGVTEGFDEKIENFAAVRAEYFLPFPNWIYKPYISMIGYKCFIFCSCYRYYDCFDTF